MIATLLATRKMSPELRARVEASVSGRRASSGAKLPARWVSLLRFVAVGAIIAAVASFVLERRRSEDEREAARASLLQQVTVVSGSLTLRQKNIVERVRPWVNDLSVSYAGDSVADELRVPGAFSKLLASPTLYIRGSLQVLNSSGGFERAAKESVRDALVLCLIDPPNKRDEKTLLRKARSAYGGWESMQKATANVSRLDDALVGLPFFDERWQAQIHAAQDVREIERLRRSFERAPTGATKAAAKASLLLFAVDEPGDEETPAELDGERPHQVRVGLADLDENRLLLRLRRGVDPSWLSARTRSEYARGVDDCSLALDVREALTTPDADSKSEALPKPEAKP